MDSWPVVVDSWEIECCRGPFSVGDEIRWRLAFVPAAMATVPVDLLVTLDAAIKTVTLLPPPEFSAESGGLDIQLLTAGPVVAAWAGSTPLAGAMPVRGALVGGWHMGGVEASAPPVTGVIRRIRVLRQSLRLDGHTLLPVPEGTQLRDVATSPKWFERCNAATNPQDQWQESGIVADVEFIRHSTPAEG